MLSYSEALKRPAPATPLILKDFNISHTTALFRQMKNYDGNPLTVVRQFSCEQCYKMWWTRVRTIKQVSKCKSCKNKYDPIPVDLEYGVGFFECECSNRFTGKSQMGHTSRCHDCMALCKPKYIINKRDDNRVRRSSKAHHCDMCNGNGKCRSYNQILIFSNLHESTGSTLASLNNQSDLDERFIDDFAENDMPSIRESASTDEEYDASLSI